MLDKTTHNTYKEDTSTKLAKVIYMVVSIFICVFILEKEDRLMMKKSPNISNIEQRVLSIDPIKDFFFSLLNISNSEEEIPNTK